MGIATSSTVPKNYLLFGLPDADRRSDLERYRAFFERMLRRQSAIASIQSGLALGEVKASRRLSTPEGRAREGA